MFEKEAQYYAFDEVKHKQEWYIKHPERSIDEDYEDIKKHWGKGAEFGYNKANEWHYVKDEGTPIHEGHYLVCLRNKDHDILDCWILFDKDIGWYSLQVRLVDIYAWKEIVLPELKESE